MKTYRCDRTYLRLVLGIHLLIALAIGVAIGFVSLPLGVICGLLYAAVALFNWFKRRTYSFSLGDGVVRTQKLFTKDIDVTTPIVNIQGVSAYEGIVGALCGVGTVEISTASSHGKHVTICWPFLARHREIAEILKSKMSAARHRT